MTLERGSRLFNRYRIKEILGQGGMGAIYRAEDENLGVDVAVKENLFTSEEFERQFRREAVILANLRHPNLPRVTDHFVLEGQGQYLVMDFIEGEDLRERIDRQGLLSDKEAVILGTAICDALTYLHSFQPQIVHRDIKPGNVKITPSGKIQLVDFGLAKFAQGSQATTTGARAMTPGYSPPEQYGTARTDPRSDIYSLGATLYMSLTGFLPEDALARAMGQIELTQIRTHNSKVSRRLAAVVEKAMEIRPEHRYQSAEEFKKALITSRVITDRSSIKDPTLSPAGGAGAGSLVPESAGLGGSNLGMGEAAAIMPGVDSGGEFYGAGTSRKSTSRSIGGRLIAVFLVLMTTVVIGGALLFQPGLVDQAIQWFNSNLPLTSQVGETATPSADAGSVTATVGDETPTNLLGSGTQPSSPPTSTPPFALNTSTPEPSETNSSQAMETPNPSPTPLGGGTGRIAYASDLTGIPQIWIMNADGSSPAQVTDMQGGACQPVWSPSGERMAFVSPCEGNQEIYPGAGIFILDLESGDVVGLPSVPGGDFDPQWSPDGSKMIFTSLRDYNRAQIYEIDLENNSVRSLSANTVRDSQPSYSPDGSRIAFVTTRRGPYQIWIMDDDGGELMLLSRSGSLKNTHPQWSPDGAVIMFTQTELLGGVPRLVAMRVEEGNLIENRVIQEVIPMREAAYSPDGAWIAFESWPEGGNHDLFIMTPNGSARQRLTDDQAYNFDPDWRP